MLRKNYVQTIAKYNKTHTKAYAFRFNLRTQADVIEQLDSQPSKAGYIARLIREDLIKQGKKPFEELTLAKFAEQVNSNDVVVLIFNDGSRLVTDKDYISTANNIIKSYKFEETGRDKKWFVEVRYA